jgi:hypothetical protein
MGPVNPGRDAAMSGPIDVLDFAVGAADGTIGTVQKTT